MTKDLQNVLEVIDDLKATNLVNVQMLKKSLLDINVKLEEISDGSEVILVRNALADFKQALDSRFEAVFENLEKLKQTAEQDEMQVANAELMQDKFKSLFSIFDSGMKLLVTKVDDIENNFSKISDANLDAAKKEFQKLSEELKIHQQEIIETNKSTDENTIERFSFVAESIKLLSENINIQTNMYKDFVEKKTAEIQEFVDKNEDALKEENSELKEVLQAKFKEIEEANIEFANDLETVKASLADALNRADMLPQKTSEAVAKEFKLVMDVANDTLSEIRILQDYSGNIVKTVNKIAEFVDNDPNSSIVEAIKELDISKNIADLFDKIDVFNNNFNVKTGFLEDQILQMKTMFSDIAISIENKEKEILQRETERVKEYYEKIEDVSTSIVNLEESLKISGVEYKEHISTLNKELNDFISEFNAIYNELSGATQTEINHSLDELKQFITVNSANYSDRLILIQEQFTQAFKDLYEALKTNNFELLEKGLHAEDMSRAQYKLLESIETKIDILAASDYREDLDELASQQGKTQNLIKILHSKVDELLHSDEISEKQMIVNRKFLEYFNGISEQVSKLTKLAQMPENLQRTTELNENILSLINEIDAKIDVLAISDYEENFEEILEQGSENKKLIQELNAKLDIIVSTNDNELLEDELQEIKDIILEQQELLSRDEDADNFLASENFDKILDKIESISKTIDEHDENSAKIKEDLVNTIISVFSNSNFVEETEEIKDFVQEKTGELSKQLVDVKSQLQTIKQNEISDYSYTLADVENDIAKLRHVLNDISSSTSSTEINQISRNIHNLTSSIDSISKNLTPAEIYQLKNNILKLNEDILSISSRTNKLLLNSDESQKTISEGLLAFSHIAYNLEERINELSNKEFNAEVATKLEKIQMLLENAASMDNTFHQVLMYLGEWVDAASNTFESINDKTNEINDISEALSELRKSSPDKVALIELIEERFEEQQSRMDRLEAKIDELTEMTKLNSNLSIVQKIDKMERMFNSLSVNIEKLTSYVD